MTRYSIKASPKKAFALISLMKAIKNNRRIEVNAKPSTALQKKMLDEFMGGFFLAIKKIKDNLDEV
jgi:hypothetical protein